MPKSYSNPRNSHSSHGWQGDSPGRSNSPAHSNRSQSPMRPNKTGFQLAGVSGRGRPPQAGQTHARPRLPAQSGVAPQQYVRSQSYPRPYAHSHSRPYQRPFRPQLKIKSPHKLVRSAAAHAPEHGSEDETEANSDANSDSAENHSLHWCQRPGQSVLMHFSDGWILGLIDGAHKPTAAKEKAGYHILIPGLCPFHIETSQDPDGKVTCGGINTHVHEYEETADGTAGSRTWTLPFPLVTQPMPLSVLLKIPKLRPTSLYFFEDKNYITSSSNLMTRNTAPNGNTAKELVSEITYSTQKVFVNPVCYRMLQRTACEKRWKLDTSSQFSIDNWANIIKSENLLYYERGMRVPRPQDSKFHSKTGVYQIAIGFWTPFQRRMWKYFLSHNTGPCYLDASYRCDTDGFQLWTLFFERSGQTVPISYLVTTGTSVRLVADWLEAIANQSDKLPRKTIFINTMKAIISVEAVFHTWDVRFAKYYIDQEIKGLVLYKQGAAARYPAVAEAVQDIGDNFPEAIAAVKGEPTLYKELSYLLSREKRWSPKTYEQVGEFNQSSHAVARWRYLLWTTMLSRPDTNRIDSVLYFLVSVLTPGVDEAISAQGDTLLTAEKFDMTSVERGGKSPVPGVTNVLDMSLTKEITCLVSSDRTSKNIVDTHYGVCFCPKFAKQGMCEHLIYCSTGNIHQQWLVKILDNIPLA